MNGNDANTQAVAKARGIDPQALIAAAIEKGAGVDTLERLVALAKDIRAVTAREAYNEAMAEFSKRCPSIKKSRTATIPTRGGGSYSYTYSPLDEVCAIVDPILSDLGLSKRWTSPKYEADKVSISCVVSHRLGHAEESGPVTIPIMLDGRMNPGQSVGSSLTYAKRYSLQNVLGIAPEDDDDLSANEREEADETTGLVSEIMELWRDMKWTRAQVKGCLRAHNLSESLADARTSWATVDLAAISSLRDDMRKEARAQ